MRASTLNIRILLVLIALLAHLTNAFPFGKKWYVGRKSPSIVFPQATASGVGRGRGTGPGSSASAGSSDSGSTSSTGSEADAQGNAAAVAGKKGVADVASKAAVIAANPKRARTSASAMGATRSSGGDAIGSAAASGNGFGNSVLISSALVRGSNSDKQRKVMSQSRSKGTGKHVAVSAGSGAFLTSH